MIVVTDDLHVRSGDGCLTGRGVLLAVCFSGDEDAFDVVEVLEQGNGQFCLCWRSAVHSAVPLDLADGFIGEFGGLGGNLQRGGEKQRSGCGERDCQQAHQNFRNDHAANTRPHTTTAFASSPINLSDS